MTPSSSNAAVAAAPTDPQLLGQRLLARGAIRPADLAPAAPGTGEPRTGLSMGEHQALTTAEWGITRAEQDELAAKSHQNLARAYDEGFFSDLITPFKGVTRVQPAPTPDATKAIFEAPRPQAGKASAGDVARGAETTADEVKRAAERAADKLHEAADD